MRAEEKGVRGKSEGEHEAKRVKHSVGGFWKHYAFIPPWSYLYWIKQKEAQRLSEWGQKCVCVHVCICVCSHACVCAHFVQVKTSQEDGFHLPTLCSQRIQCLYGNIVYVCEHPKSVYVQRWIANLLIIGKLKVHLRARGRTKTREKSPKSKLFKPGSIFLFVGLFVFWIQPI